MRGMMMDRPLLVSDLIEFAAQYHGRTEIVSRTVEGPIHRYTYADARDRSKRLANALRRLGIAVGDRVATLAWNGYRHFELYFGTSGIGAVCHTVNPRLFSDQLVYIFNHAGDRYVFFDVTFTPLLEGLADELPLVEGYVAMTDRANLPESSLPNLLCYEDLLAAESPELVWPEFDETTASSLCYTSGTTGEPKGAVYTHRSTVLHTFSICQAEVLALSSHHTVMPVVPMFHANAWGLPYGCAMCGAKMVFPGALMDGESIYELLHGEEVTLTAGVPTVWLMLFDHLRKTGARLDQLDLAVVGGAAAPESMIRAFEEEYGVTAYHAWGMTEMSPVGSNGRLTRAMEDLPVAERCTRKLKQGRGMFGVEWKIVDTAGKRLPHDGQTFGELLVRGPWIVSGYFENPEASAAAFDAEGWFRTGDVATIDPDGFMQIVDRSKDVIKSGGEWISSIDLENAAVGHPDVAEAAVIGMPHPKWDERPLLVVVAAEGKAPQKDDLLEYLSGRVARWWLPDDVVVVKELPHTATGKISKFHLREQFKDYRLPTAAEA